MKRSKLQRKFLNQMRGMSDVPWPARRFRVAPTFGQPLLVGTCQRTFGEVEVPRPGFRNRVMRRSDQVAVRCGGALVLVPFKRKLRCQDCVDRKRSERRLQMEREGLRRHVEQLRRDASWGAAARRLFSRKAS